MLAVTDEEIQYFKKDITDPVSPQRPLNRGEVAWKYFHLK